jgi:hypothetical protein
MSPQSASFSLDSPGIRRYIPSMLSYSQIPSSSLGALLGLGLLLRAPRAH